MAQISLKTQNLETHRIEGDIPPTNRYRRTGATWKPYLHLSNIYNISMHSSLWIYYPTAECDIYVADISFSIALLKVYNMQRSEVGFSDPKTIGGFVYSEFFSSVSLRANNFTV